MKLTRSVSYALGVLLQIERLSAAGPVTAARIARGCRFPPRFLYRVLRRLVDAGILQGTSGPGGGYALAKRPRRITMLEVASAVESGPEPTVLMPVAPSHRRAIARLNRLCKQSAQEFAESLGRLTLADLAGDRRSNRRKRPRKKAD